MEPLSFGGLCVVSNVCGCAGFVKAVTGGQDVRNVIIADYTQLNWDSWYDLEDLQQINKEARDRIEQQVSQRVALEICARLPKQDAEVASMIETGYSLAKHMGWEAVAEKYVLKSLRKATQKQHRGQIHLGA